MDVPQSFDENFVLPDEIWMPLILCVFIVLFAVAVRYAFPRNSLSNSSPQNCQQGNRTVDQPTKSRSKSSGNVRRRRHSNSLEKPRSGSTDTMRPTSHSKPIQKGTEEQQQRHFSSISKKKEPDIVCVDSASSGFTSQDSHLPEPTEPSPLDAQSHIPPMVSEATVPEQPGPTEEWRSVVRKPKKGRKPPMKFEPGKAVKESDSPHIEPCPKQEIPATLYDAPSSLDSATMPPREAQLVQESIPPPSHGSSTNIVREPLSPPPTLTNQPPATEPARLRRKRRNRLPLTCGIKNDDVKIEPTQAKFAPDLTEDKPVLDDSEFEVVEASSLLSFSPCPSSESDQAITEVNTAAQASMIVEIPSISNVEQFPCLPGTENQFVAPGLVPLEAREGGRHPHAVRLLTSALDENGNRPNTQRTIRSKARKAD